MCIIGIISLWIKNQNGDFPKFPNPVNAVLDFFLPFLPIHAPPIPRARYGISATGLSRCQRVLRSQPAWLPPPPPTNGPAPPQPPPSVQELLDDDELLLDEELLDELDELLLDDLELLDDELEDANKLEGLELDEREDSELDGLELEDLLLLLKDEMLDDIELEDDRLLDRLLDGLELD